MTSINEWRVLLNNEYYIIDELQLTETVKIDEQKRTNTRARIILSMLFLKYQLALIHIKLRVSWSCSNKQQPI